MEVIGIRPPFSRSEFLRANEQDQIEMAKILMEKVADAAKGRRYNWSEKVEMLKEVVEDDPIMTCHHEADAIKTALGAERDLETLRASMEDLCTEMDRIKEEASKVFVMGPSEEEVVRRTIQRLKAAGLLKSGVGPACEDSECELCYMRVALPGYGD